jgi:hypothetical protein
MKKYSSSTCQGTRAGRQVADRNRLVACSTRALLPSLAAFFLCGCQNLTYTAPGGEHFSRTTFGARSSIAALVVETSTNGVRRVELRGYSTDASKEWEAITAAAVRAAIEGAK